MAMGDLFERDGELAAISELIGVTREGSGKALLVEGPAGIGKTVLLERGRAMAQSAGIRVLFARGGELESEFPYGVVRQLFESELWAMPAERRRELLQGAAELAAPLVSPQAPATVEGPSADRSFAVLHGLYWLTLNMAAERPLLLIVDDLHWTDAATQRFVAYLTRRLEGSSIATLLAIRTAEPGTQGEAIRALEAQPGIQVLRPAPLGEEAVSQVLEAGLGQEPQEAFTAACHGATGGVPFLAWELVAALAADGVTPQAENADDVKQMGPTTVAHATMLRLGRLPESATSLAQAVAILGGHARLDRATRLAGLEDRDGVQLVDALVTAQILSPGQPLEFVHPIVRAAIYEELPAGRRSDAHGRAARLLAEEGAEIDVVASQLLSAAPAGDPWVVDQLRSAAASALDRGAPEGAVAYLRRALEEGLAGRELRSALFHELGVAEKLLRDPSASAHLQQAMVLEDDPAERARIALTLVELLGLAGDWDALPILIESSLGDLGDLDPDLARRLEAHRAGLSGYQPAYVSEFDRQLANLRRLAAEAGTGAQEISLVLAGLLGMRGESAAEIRLLVDQGLADGEFLAGAGVESWILPQAFAALVVIEELERALDLASETIAIARRTGSLLGFLIGLGNRAWVEVRRGNVAGAEADVRTTLNAIQEHGMQMAMSAMLSYAADVITERPSFADVASMVETLELPPDLTASYNGSRVLELRGRLRLIEGRRAEALEDLRASWGICEQLEFNNPSFANHRGLFALALAGEDPDRARELVESELADAEKIGLPRGIGVALRTAGMIEGKERNLPLLQEAVDVLADSPARLEHARALVELGAALRRANRRAAAREPLRLGLDMAHDCGATRLAERAHTELAATGARPRRDRITGRDALTPSEQRIAEMAVEGLSNRDIAEALFVTPKTVENHLGHVYRKLEVSGREELREALERERIPA
jgi:DNA-binding CsgD family transcriptional regulator